MIGIITTGAAILGAVIYWRMTRNDPLLRADGSPTETWTAEPLSETDIDIEPRHIPALMKTVQGLFARGFDSVKTQNITERSTGLDVDDEIDLQYQVQWNGATATLDMKIFRDDIESVIFYFRGPHAMIESLEKALEQFQTEQESEPSSGAYR